MISFWRSVDKLAYEGLKVAWLGVCVTCLGLVFPDYRWLSWFGFGATALGLVLRHRGEYLKRRASTPRNLSTEQKQKLLIALENVPKQSLVVGFFGQDLEAKSFAIEIKNVFESAHFPITRVEGFIVFEMQYGLSITVYDAGATNPTATGIQQAFRAAGLDIKLQLNQNQMEPKVHVSVHSKPLR